MYKPYYLADTDTVLENLRKNILLKRPEVWVRHDLRVVAEQLMEQLIDEGLIKAYRYRKNYSCNGSANYKIEYSI